MQQNDLIKARKFINEQAKDKYWPIQNSPFFPPSMKEIAESLLEFDDIPQSRVNYIRALLPLVGIKNFKKYLSDLSEDHPMTMIDLMAQTGTVSDFAKKIEIKRGLSFRRGLAVGIGSNNGDNYNNKVDYIDGNLLSGKTWRNIIKWKDEYAPNGVDIINIFPIAAIKNIPPKHYERAFYRSFNILIKNGIIAGNYNFNFNKQFKEYIYNLNKIIGLEAAAEKREGYPPVALIRKTHNIRLKPIK